MTTTALSNAPAGPAQFKPGDGGLAGPMKKLNWNINAVDHHLRVVAGDLCVDVRNFQLGTFLALDLEQFIDARPCATNSVPMFMPAAPPAAWRACAA